MIQSMTDGQWCSYMTRKYGEAKALELYAQFPDRDGTAPAHFADYAASFGAKHSSGSGPIYTNRPRWGADHVAAA